MILTDFNDEELVEYRMKIRDIACDLELENDIIISPIVRNIEKYKSFLYECTKRRSGFYMDENITVSGFAKYILERAIQDLSDAEFKRYKEGGYVKDIREY